MLEKVLLQTTVENIGGVAHALRSRTRRYLGIEDNADTIEDTYG